MSYDINHVIVRTLEASISAEDLRELHAMIRSDPNGMWAPSGNFLEDLYSGLCAVPSATELRLVNFNWSGECSGRGYYDFLLEVVAPKIRGLVEVALLWPDHISGLQIRDGIWFDCDVALTLAPRPRSKP